MTGADDAEKANRFLAWIEQLKADMQIPRYIDPNFDRMTKRRSLPGP